VRPVQYFSDDYLDQCRAMKPDDVIRYLEDFRHLHSNRPAPSRLISMKVPQDLLDAFKTRAKLIGKPYQTLIKDLMRAWVIAED
jgi:predicted DNA binding CopG/RHH family protein